MTIANEPTPARATSAAAYAALRRDIRTAGLLNRAIGYYFAYGSLCYVLIAIAVTIAFILPASWGWSALAALLLGVGSAQVGLLGHDAGHCAIFRRLQTNWMVGELCWSLTLGVAFGYWWDRHNKHHAHTNDRVEDPDLRILGLAILTYRPLISRRLWQSILKRYLSTIALVTSIFLDFHFRIHGWQFAIRKLKGRRRLFEVVLLTLNALLCMAPVAFLGIRWLVLYLGSQLVGSLYFGLVSAPNHKGMPIRATRTHLPFLERHTQSSRNIAPNPLWDLVYGGLNHQIEHHLFPTMARVHLNQARAIIKPFCAANGLPFLEMSISATYTAITQEYRRLGRELVEAATDS
jgi:fatty acid desaturase